MAKSKITTTLGHVIHETRFKKTSIGKSYTPKANVSTAKQHLMDLKVALKGSKGSK